jgi:hypothetical protein
MLLSFEIPTQHLEEFIPLEDFEFGLAHLFLNQDFKGAEEYVKRYQGCLLDNSMYELGGPLSVEALLKATELAKPCAVIAPDYMDDHVKTLAGVYDLYQNRPQKCKWTIAGVVQGADYEARRKCYLELQRCNASPICFPFRSPREDTIKRLAQEGLIKTHKWYHLLGLRSLDELRWKLPGYWSCDTGKVFKGFNLSTTNSIRGQGQLNLTEPLSLTARRLAGCNIAYLRWLTRDHERQIWKERKR